MKPKKIFSDQYHLQYSLGTTRSGETEWFNLKNVADQWPRYDQSVLNTFSSQREWQLALAVANKDIMRHTNAVMKVYASKLSPSALFSQSPRPIIVQRKRVPEFWDQHSPGSTLRWKGLSLGAGRFRGTGQIDSFLTFVAFLCRENPGYQDFHFYISPDAPEAASKRGIEIYNNINWEQSAIEVLKQAS